MSENEIELNYYGTVVRRGWWIITAMVFFALVATLLVGPKPETRYQAEATVLVRQITDDPFGATNSRGVNIATERSVAESTVVAQRALSALASEQPAADFLEDLTVLTVTDSQVLAFAFVADSPELAVSGASAASDAYLQFRGDNAREQSDQALEALQTKIDDAEAKLVSANFQLAATPPDTPEFAEAQTNREILIDQLKELQRQFDSQSAIDINPGEVIDRDNEAEEIRIGVSRWIQLLVGGFLGAVVGTLLAFVTERLDDRVRNARDIEDELQVPVLAHIPSVRQGASWVVVDQPISEAADGFRRVAVGISGAKDGPRQRSILVTSSRDREGRSTTALNLAAALARSGCDVLLVGADRRSVDLDTILGVGTADGLVDLNANPPGESLASVLADRISLIHPNLWYLPTGGISGGEPLSMDLMRALLKLAAHLQLSVVIDAPPALRNADGLELATLVDGVVVTAVSRRTGRSDLAELRGQLRRVGGHVFGAVSIDAVPAELLSQGTVNLRRLDDQASLGGSSSRRDGVGRGGDNPKGALGESSEPEPSHASAVVATSVADTPVAEPSVVVATSVADTSVAEPSHASAVVATSVAEPSHASAVVAASVADTSVADASVVAASVPDASVADTSVADASVVAASVADTSVADASVVAASVADTSVADASVVAASVADTSVADTSVAEPS
ncbi:MAG: hypothetical protein GY745_21935, partial [Actinomycetia bacterium]|nr:hypothetical protein [Actinomycetes bacterium]